MLVTSWLQGRPMDRRSVWVSVAGAALLWALFVWVLRVPYPTGRWVPFA